MKKSKNDNCNLSNKVSPIVIIASIGLTLLLPLNQTTESSFNETSSALVKASADSIKAPTGLKVESLIVGQTNLSWKVSTSSYTTGYRILRSDNVYGPWSVIGEVAGKDKTSYIDTTSGADQWIYRVEAVWSKWVSTSPGFEAPPAVGRSFYDDFKTIGDLNGRVTGDGSSIWLVWTGRAAVEDRPLAAFGYDDGLEPATVVIRTPTQDAHIFAKDFDGSEGFVIRGKDPKNYIYFGGALGGTSTDGTFEAVVTKNGIRTILQKKNTNGINRDMRLEAVGNKIKVYIDAKEGVKDSGTLFMSQEIDFLYGDPTATYFGMGFTGRNGFLGYSFEAV